jgi:hypothetical protein
MHNGLRQCFLFLLFFGVGRDRVHSVRWPIFGLLDQPRVIDDDDESVEWKLAGETRVLGENLPQCQFVQDQIPRDVTWYPTRATTVGSRRATNRLSCGMAINDNINLLKNMKICDNSGRANWRYPKVEWRVGIPFRALVLPTYAFRCPVQVEGPMNSQFLVQGFLPNVHRFWGAKICSK